MTPGRFEVDAPPEVLEAALSGAVFVANVSGGKDGLCAAHAAFAWLDSVGHPRSRRRVLHADLGRGEWVETPGTVERQAAFLGAELMVVRRAKGDIVALWEQRYADGLPDYDALRRVRLRGPWSGPGFKFCQPGTKRDVMIPVMRRAFPSDQVVNVVGVRRDESRDRAKAVTYAAEPRMSTPGRTRGFVWNAIAHWTTPDVFAYAADHRLPMHEAYSVWGSSRVSCAACVFMSKGDRAASFSNPSNLPLLRTLVGIENRTGFAFQKGSWLSDARPDALDADVLAAAALARAYSTERAMLEALVPDAFLAGSADDPWPRRPPTLDEARAIAEARRLVSSWRGIDLPFATTAAVIDGLSRPRSLQAA